MNIKRELFISIIIFLFIDISTTYAEEIDTLKSRLESVSNQDKIEVLNQLAGSYWELPPNDRIAFAEQAIELSEAFHDQKSKADAYNHLGVAYNNLGDSQKSMDYFLKALNIMEEINDKNGIANSYLNIGQANFYLDNFNKALEYFQKNLNLRYQIGDKKYISQALNTIGNVMSKTAKYDKALEYYSKALEISNEINDKMGISQLYNNIGNVYLATGEQEKVLKYRLKSLQIVRELNNKWETALTTHNIAEYYLLNKEPVKAYRYIIESKDLAKELNNKGLLNDNISLLSLYYELKGDYQKALKHQKDYAKITKEQFSEELSENIAEMQIKYETKKKEKEIVLLKNESIIKSLELDKQKNYRNLAIISSAFIFFVVVLISVEYRRKIRSNKLLRSLNDEIKQGYEKIHVQAEHLQISKKKLQVANKELEAFSYSISHDLRAPLRAIDGFTSILMDDYASKFDKEGKRLGEIIQDNTEKMGKLINDLLAFSRMGRAAMHISKIDMKNMVNAIYHEATSAIERKRITFNIAKLSKAEGDTNMMRQVWINLISNAVKFSSHRKQAIISVTCKEEEDKLTYCIKDNGVGFNMKYVDKLFGVFQRLHSEKEFEGTGVGLALVQRIIHRHDGEVWAEGEVDKGATFYFSLPKKKRWVLQ